MAALCRVCSVETFIGDAHPCCVRWADLEPGEPCPSCNASRAFWAKRRHTKRKAAA